MSTHILPEAFTQPQHCSQPPKEVHLAVSLLAASYLLLKALTTIGIPLGIAKVLGDGAIYVASYVAQRRLVFTERG